jgi:opacity protein-like surface antigen
MKQFGVAAALMLVSMGSAMAADVYDAVYVSDAAVCERAGEADMGQVLFDLHAAAVAPRVGFWVGGEMNCTLYDPAEHPSPIADTPADVEIYATARCYAAEVDFRDSVIVTSVSQGINLDNGDTGETPPAKIEVMSMRADLGGETVRAQDGYAGIYTLCEALKAENFQ